MDKIWLQILLYSMAIASLNIFLLDVNFDKSTNELCFLPLSFVLAKFLED